jgi:cysteine desulfurase / selenocysteine lyase
VSAAQQVTTPAPLDAARLREDFPIFRREVHGRPLAYLDSASTAQKPRQVLDAMVDLYSTSYANVHRGVYTIAQEATEAYEAVRERVRALLNASSTKEIVFTRDATEALNLVAYSYGRANVREGDVIAATVMEHHSNLVPWQVLARETGATLCFVPMTDEGELDLSTLDEIAATGPVKLLAVTDQSNSLGTRNPVRELADWVHGQGGVIVVDGAQSVPHRPVDVQALDCDFLAFSGHKLCGPSGAGGLYGRRALLEAMPPFLTGGEMIRSVHLDRTSWNELPWKFEAGTPAIAEVVGMGAAIDYLQAIGLEAIHAHEARITAYALERLREVPGVTVYGPSDPAHRGGVVSFVLDGVHPHDVAEILDRDAVCVRAGHHCTQPVMERLGIGATTRASFYLYTVEEEVDRLIEGLHRARETFGL